METTRKNLKSILTENAVPVDCPSDPSSQTLISEGLSEGIPFEETITIQLSGDVQIESFSEDKQPSSAKQFHIQFNKEAISEKLRAAIMKALQSGMSQDIAENCEGNCDWIVVQTSFSNRPYVDKTKED